MRHLGVQLGLDAVLGEVVPQELRRLRLVAGRIDRVEPDQALEELDDLVAKGQPSSSFARAVSRSRAVQSSGYIRLVISRPSTSTGVPWVPTTCSPMIRATV